MPVIQPSSTQHEGISLPMRPKSLRHRGPQWTAAIAALLVPAALLAWFLNSGLNVGFRGPAQAVDGTDHKSVQSAPKEGEDPGATSATAYRHVGRTGLVSAHRGLEQAIDLVNGAGAPTDMRLQPPLDSDGPFIPNLFDPSDANIATIEQQSLAGSDDALAAFLTVAAHLPDYRERSQRLLLLNAARGSVLALTTLSERSLVGFGFESPDRAASIFFEYLAWATGRWNTDIANDAFRPSIALRTSRAECDSAVALARRVAAEHQAFKARDHSDASTCVDRELRSPWSGTT